MIYASLVEIIQKGVSHLGDSGMSDIESYRYATLMFAAGVVCAFGLDVVRAYFKRRLRSTPSFRVSCTFVTKSYPDCITEIPVRSSCTTSLSAQPGSRHSPSASPKRRLCR